MNITEIFLALARARTPAERVRILQKASSSGRFDEDQRTELRSLASERDMSSVNVLRPITNPLSDCKYLDALQATQSPILPDDIATEVEEWVEGWRCATDLEMAGLRPPGPMLVHGPTGTGKSMLCGTLGQRTSRTGVVVECHNMVDSHMGCTGERLAQAFRAIERAGSLLVIEELDALAADRGSSGGGDKAVHENARITVALMRMIESARFPIVATTNRTEALDSALLRRFEYKVAIPELPMEIRHRIIRDVLGSVPAELVEMPLNDALPKARRMVRAKFVALSPKQRRAATADHV